MENSNPLEENFIKNTSLLRACENNNEIEIKELIKSGLVDINQEDNLKNTPLILASIRNKEKIIKYLIKHGAILKKENVFGDVPLTIFCINNKENIIKYIYDNCFYDNTFIKKILIQYKNNKSWSKNDFNQIIYDENNKLKEIVNYKSLFYDTPLNIAISNQQETIMKYLIEMGADVNKVNEEGETPLIIACKNNANEKLVRYLVKKGANVNAKK